MRREEVETAFERFGPMVYRRARAVLGNDEEARDIVQEVFIKVLSGRMKAEGPMAGWLQTVTTRACLNHVRNRTRRAEILAEQAREREIPVDHENEQRVLVRTLLDRLDPRTAEAAICVHIDGMTYDETSRHLRVSRRTVANLLHRFQATAQQMIEPPPKAVGEEG